MPEIIWQRIGSGDYKAEVDGFMLRVECMDRGVWWWTVYGPDKQPVGKSVLTPVEPTMKLAKASAESEYQKAKSQTTPA